MPNSKLMGGDPENFAKKIQRLTEYKYQKDQFIRLVEYRKCGTCRNRSLCNSKDGNCACPKYAEDDKIRNKISVMKMYLQKEAVELGI